MADVSAYDGMSAILKLQAFLSIRTTGALWFLYVLFIIFVVQRLLIKAIWKSNKIVLTWICAFVAVNIASYKFSGPVHHVMLYNFYFFLGVLIHRCQKNSVKSPFLLSGVAATVGTVILILIQPIGIIDSIVRLITASAYVYLAFGLSKKCENVFCKPFYVTSDLSMGIYLFHEPLIVAIGSKLPGEMRGAVVLSFIVVGVFFSMGITIFLRKIGLKFVMGE